MNRLDQSIIDQLAYRFCILTEDEPRQAIVDSLGNHPVNHARFARLLSNQHPHNWQVYLNLTRHL